MGVARGSHEGGLWVARCSQVYGLWVALLAPAMIRASCTTV
jgi:hypothetical protein